MQTAFVNVFLGCYVTVLVFTPSFAKSGDPPRADPADVFVFTSIKAWRRPGPQSRDPRVGDRVAGSGRFKGDGVLLRTLVAGLV
jgi:hypothetical protein